MKVPPPAWFALCWILCCGSTGLASIQGISQVAIEEDGESRMLTRLTVGEYSVPVAALAPGKTELGRGADTSTIDGFDLANYAKFSHGRNWRTTDLAGEPLYHNVNGPDPDIFLFLAGATTIGDATVTALLKNDTTGVAVTLPGSAFIDTGVQTSDGRHVHGISFALTDLLDNQSQALNEETGLAGLDFTISSGTDGPACLCVALAPADFTLISPALDEADLTGPISFAWSSVTSIGTVQEYRLSLSDGKNTLIDAQVVTPDPGDGLQSGAFVWNGTTTNDTVYTWSVEALIVDEAGGASPFTFAGPSWRFRGIRTVPELAGPSDALLLPDKETLSIYGDANFTVDITPRMEVTDVAWYRASDPNQALVAGERILIETTETQTRLTVLNPSLADNDKYYCVAMAASGNSIASQQAQLDLRYVLRHRWSFNNSSLADTGTLGGAHAVIVDPCEVTITFTDNQIVFGGGLRLGHNLRAVDPFIHWVDLPNHIISNLGRNNATFMVWFTDEDVENANNDHWERVFEFGGPVTLEEGAINLWETGNPPQQPEVETIYLAPKGGNNRILMQSPFHGFGQLAQNGKPAPLMEETMVAVTYEASTRQGIMYVNGKKVDDATLDNNYHFADLPDLNNWIGRGQFDHDSNFIGKINELRIYDVPLNAGWIWASFMTGPDALPNEPVAPPVDPPPDGGGGRR